MMMAEEEPGWNDAGTPTEGPGDTALRQLRQRYETLRHDYEELLDRLGDVEKRLLDAQRSSAEQGTILPGSLRTESREFLLAPLGRLRDDYLMIADDLITIANSLNDLTARAMKGQRGGSSQQAPPIQTPPQPTGQPLQPTAQPQHSASGEPQRVSLHVQSGGLGHLLDFQEQLSQLPGVDRVSISQVNEDRAVLTVELADDVPSTPPPAPAQ